MKKQLYDFSCYDENLSLKVPFALRFAIFFGAKNFLFIVIAFSPSAKISGQNSSLFSAFVDPLAFPGDLLSLIVLITWLNRTSTAKSIWYKIWPWGRQLLIASYCYHLLILAVYIYTAKHIESTHGLITLAMVAIDLFILRYLFRSNLLKDLFNEFPQK